jgi:photosystem II stability/assembly factor-like uncharacterized protein
MSSLKAIHLTRALPFALVVAVFFSIAGHAAYSQSDTYGPWQRLPDPFASDYKSRLTDLEIAPDGTFYASAYPGGVAKSSDHGRTWTLMNDGLPNLRVWAIGFNSLGEPMASLGVKPSEGVFRYSNGRWDRSRNISATYLVSKFALDRTGALIAVTGYAGDVYRSTDNGNSFYKTASNIGGVGALWTVAKGPDGALYIGGEVAGGLYVSHDNGTSWAQMALSTGQKYTGNLQAISFNKQGDLLVGRVYGPDGSSVQRFSGGSWTESSKGMSGWLTVRGFAMDSHGTIYLAAFSHGGSAVYRSLDNGLSWQDFAFGLNSTYSHIVVDSNDNVYLVALNEIYKAAPGLH